MAKMRSLLEDDKPLTYWEQIRGGGIGQLIDYLKKTSDKPVANTYSQISGRGNHQPHIEDQIEYGPQYDPGAIEADLKRQEALAPIPVKNEVKQVSQEAAKKKLTAKKLVPTYGPRHDPKAIQKGLDDEAKAKLKARLMAKLEAEKAEDKAKSDDLDRQVRMGQYAALAGEVLADQNEKQDAYYHRKSNARAEIGGLSPVKYDHSILRRTGQMAKDLTAQERAEYIKKKLQEKADAKDDSRYADKRKDVERGFKLKEDQFGETKRHNRVKERLASRKAGTTTTLRGRMSKLSGEERKRLDSATMAFDATNKMREALKNGDNTFSIIGDNDFTMAARLWEDAIGRMQSGGAINAEEGDRFRAMAPKWTDSSEIQRKKLDWMESEMTKRINNLGFSPNELSQPRQPSQQDKDAYEWAQQNPDDPRSKVIMKKLGGLYGR